MQEEDRQNLASLRKLNHNKLEEIEHHHPLQHTPRKHTH